MTDIERREMILQQLRLNYSVKVAELSKLLYIGEATIRRDLGKLERADTVSVFTAAPCGLTLWIGNCLPMYVRRITWTQKSGSVQRQQSSLRMGL